MSTNYIIGSNSRSHLSQAHPDFTIIAEELIKIIDFSADSSHRNQRSQDQAFASGRSKVQFPNSKHNSTPSNAIHFNPWPIKWPDKLYQLDAKQAAKVLGRFYLLSGIVIGISSRLYNERKITSRIRWGGDWDMDGDILDQTFDDLTHFELIDS